MGASETQLTLVDGSNFPQPPFLVTITDGNDHEIIEVNSLSGNILGGLIRGVEGTSSRAWPAGSSVENRWTAGTYHKLKDVLEGLFIEEGADW
jgi:hypothetical protein